MPHALRFASLLALLVFEHVNALATPPPQPQTMFRKGLPFGHKPTFRQQMQVTDGIINAGPNMEPLPCRYARLGTQKSISGNVAFALPSEANTAVADNIAGGIAIVSRGACSFESKLRNCAASGALAVVLVNSEDELILAAPDPPSEDAPQLPVPEIPYVVVSATDGAALGRDGDTITISPVPSEAGLPLFLFRRPLLPGESRPIRLSLEERHALAKHVARGSGDEGGGAVAVLMCTEDAAVAEVGAIARVELPGTADGGEAQAVLTAESVCHVRALMRDGTPSEYGLVCLDEERMAKAEAAEEAEAEEAAALVTRMLSMLECEQPAALGGSALPSPLPSPRALSFALCGAISLDPKQQQAVLELSTLGRLGAMSEQLKRNPRRGKELLGEAAYGKQRPPKVRGESCSGAGGEGAGRRGGGGGGSRGSRTGAGPKMSASVTAGAPTSSASVSGCVQWALRVDVGREAGTSMPAEWAKSGGRMPFSVEVNVLSAPVTKEASEPKVGDGACAVEPCVPVVSITGFSGAVQIPVSSGGWRMADGKLAFWLDFPEGSTRGDAGGDTSNVWGLAPGVATQAIDVTLPAGRLLFETQIWTDAELEGLNKEYLAARSVAWRAKEAVRKMEKAKSPVPKWSVEKQAWVSAAGLPRRLCPCREQSLCAGRQCGSAPSCEGCRGGLAEGFGFQACEGYCEPGGGRAMRTV